MLRSTRTKEFDQNLAELLHTKNVTYSVRRIGIDKH